MNQKSYTNTFNNNSQGYVQNSTYNGYDQNKVSNRNKDSVNYFKYNNANENNYHKGEFSSTSIDYKYNKWSQSNNKAFKNYDFKRKRI